MKPMNTKIFTLRRGFTLMEMLVAVTIVLLIMLMLAQVFELATGAMVKQKGTAENDQQARTFTTIIKEDLGRRTFLDVVPFYPRSENELIETDPEETRKGYFYYAENNPSSQQDDVLGFTMYEPVGDRRFLGHATFMRDPNVGGNGVDDDQDGSPDEADEGVPANYLYFNSDQPEGDDGLVIIPDSTKPLPPGYPYSSATDLIAVPNNIGMSKYAEVVYFLRGTNLHRRVMLLRDPYNPVNSTDFTPSYVSSNYPGPAAARYAPLNSTLGGDGNGTGEFYRDFDYSAYYEFLDDGDGSPRDYNGPRFNSWQSLNNHPTTLQQLGELNVPTSLGAPFRRYGHHFLDGLNVSLAPLGRPREFVRPINGSPQEDANSNGWLDIGEDLNSNGILDDQFIGRFLSQESAHAAFNYPGAITGTAVGTPISTIYTNPLLTLNTQTFEVNQLSGNTIRRGEDILMTNVTEFDVQILDDGLPTPKFVNLGHSEKNSGGSPIGYYNITRNSSFSDNDNDGLLDYTYDSASQKFLPTEPLLYGNRYDTWYARQIETLTGIGIPEALYNFQRAPYRPFSPGPDGVPGDLTTAPAPWESLPDADYAVDYLDRNFDPTDPSYTPVYDRPEDLNGNGTLDPGEDLNGNGILDAGDLLAEDMYGFPGSDDIPSPAKAIKITVRFVDPTNKLIRQVTIIESLVK